MCLSSIHCLSLTQNRRPGKGGRRLLFLALLGVPGHRLLSQRLVSRRGTAWAAPWPTTSWLLPLSSKAQPVGKCPSGILPQLPGMMSVVAKAVDPAGKGASMSNWGLGSRPITVALRGSPDHLSRSDGADGWHTAEPAALGGTTVGMSNSRRDPESSYSETSKTTLFLEAGTEDTTQQKPPPSCSPDMGGGWGRALWPYTAYPQPSPAVKPPPIYFLFLRSCVHGSHAVCGICGCITNASDLEAPNTKTCSVLDPRHWAVAG